MIESFLDGKVSIICADVVAGLRDLPDDHVDCVITSPPYWGLRDYGVIGQLGLEPTLGEHLDKMVEVFGEVRRVLKPSGTLWINYGDCYATTVNGRSAADTKAIGNDDRTFRDKPFSTIGPILATSGHDGDRANGGKESYRPNSSHRVVEGGYLKPKDLCMVPNRLAIALQEDGWWVRSEIVWGKPNPMPSSIKDRPATAHEKIWLLSKAPKYFYDNAGVKQPFADKRQHGGRNLRNYEPAPLDVLVIPTKAFKDAHFATFPPDLAARCIKAGSPHGGLVLDPFGGAGTVPLVASALGRRSIMIELNKEYCAMARERIEQMWMGPEQRQRALGKSFQQTAGDLPLFAEAA